MSAIMETINLLDLVTTLELTSENIRFTYEPDTNVLTFTFANFCEGVKFELIETMPELQIFYDGNEEYLVTNVTGGLSLETNFSKLKIIKPDILFETETIYGFLNISYINNLEEENNDSVIKYEEVVTINNDNNTTIFINSFENKTEGLQIIGEISKTLIGMDIFTDSSRSLVQLFIEEFNGNEDTVKDIFFTKEQGYCLSENEIEEINIKKIIISAGDTANLKYSITEINYPETIEED